MRRATLSACPEKKTTNLVRYDTCCLLNGEAIGVPLDRPAAVVYERSLQHAVFSKLLVAKRLGVPLLLETRTGRSHPATLGEYHATRHLCP